MAWEISFTGSSGFGVLNTAWFPREGGGGGCTGGVLACLRHFVGSVGGLC